MAGKGPDFATIRSEGALLPPDLLARIQANDPDLPHLSAKDYHLPGGMRLNEAASRAWNALRGAWASFQEVRARLPEDDPGTSPSRERWLLPLFQELGYGRLETRERVEIEGRSYALSHGYKHAPIHLVGCNVSLETRSKGVAGAAYASPHSLVQEFLNRRDDNLWGVVSNGLRLRILRDNLALTRQAYLEFDLEAMMEGEAYSDFVLLYLLLHQSRLEEDDPHDCVLEAWSKEAAETGTRVLRDLSRGVERAITALGQGFLADSGNDALKAALRNGELGTQDYYRQLLRLVYRLLFLFVAEDRDALHPPERDEAARERYEHYATRRLRHLAERLRGGRHPDGFEALKAVFRALGGDGAPGLGLPALGSFLFSEEAAPHLMAARLPNAYLYQAVRALAYAEIDGVRRPVDYKNLGSEELGGVYEGLLELHPEVDATAGTFRLASAAGNERKTTGSYYTPSSLISLLLDSALDPVLDARLKGKRAAEAEKALLDTKVVDPACGSGHFLIAAAQRMAKRLATIRTGDEEPAPEELRPALREVVNRCLYGVDVSEMSAELCKVALWMEALEPGKPLSFLEHRIQVGNSLIGATPELIGQGIPDEAFKPIEGDEKKVASGARKKNKQERGGQSDMFDASPPGLDPEVVRSFHEVEAIPFDTIAQAREKAKALREAVAQDRYRRARAVADGWCAAFVWPLRNDAPPPITTSALRTLEEGRTLAEARDATIRDLRDRHAFFHWHVAFPEVFGGNRGGFDVVMGNPPWEHVELKEKEWFQTRAPEIAAAQTGAMRKRRIVDLAEVDPKLYAAFLAAKRQHDGVAFFAANSGRFPLTGRGRINTYPLFAELARDLLAAAGRSGMIVPSGIATDATTQYFFQDLVERASLASLYDFENRKKLFPGIDSRIKFCLLSTAGRGTRIPEAEFAFFLHQPTDLRDPYVRFTLSPEDIALINPNTKTCPIFRSQRDAEITKGIYRRVPVLVNESTGENSWGVSFRQGLFNMTSDSGLFRTRDQLKAEGLALVGNRFVGDDLEYLPLYEAKMFHQFDHRFATYEPDGTIREVTEEEKADPKFVVMPRYWVKAYEVAARTGRSAGTAEVGTFAPLLAFRNITNSTNERTMIMSALPLSGVGNSAPLMQPDARLNHDALYALLVFGNSFVHDYVARQKAGGSNLNFYLVKQFPVPRPDDLNRFDYDVRAHVHELVATATDLENLGEDDTAPQSVGWDSERRLQIRAELDAICFHLYGVSREDASYILDTFPIVRRRDEEAYGHFRTKEAILKALGDVARSEATGEAFKTRVDPPPPQVGVYDNTACISLTGRKP